ncbi:MAG: trigger factor [Bryobacteraceae bacterium]
MALIEGCKHSLEITVPLDEVVSETAKVVENVQKRARLPGFRPGKAPATIIQQQFQGEIRKKVLENLIPRALQKRLNEEELRSVSTPDITRVKFEPGEPLEFTAEFEVAPEFELKDYRGLTVVYQDPEITDADIDTRIGELRERKAEYVNIDPRPLDNGDHAVVSLESRGGLEGAPVKQDEMMLELGGEDTLPAFTENLRGLSPGESKEFDVTYPGDYGQKRLAGKTVRFEAVVKGIRRKELPELNDEFAQDLGDYKTLDELRQEVRRSLTAEKQFAAQREAKNKLVESLVDAHEFPVPEAYVDRQISLRFDQQLRALSAEGVDLSNFKPDWKEVKAAQRDRALREVKASLLLGKIADRESIDALRDEVDREVERFARQHREPVAAVRLRMERDGALGQIASQIQTQKVLNFLFEHSRKIAEEEA